VIASADPDHYPITGKYPAINNFGFNDFAILRKSWGAQSGADAKRSGAA
jgi:hypothetical protein